MSAKVYNYRPLKYPTSIRLLRVESKRTGGHICCILEQFDDHIPPYSALSYYWGEPENSKKIPVDLGGTLIDIHETLWEFLDEVQRSQETETWFWTDFLCLDQDNKTEMGQQVRRMGDIYAEAGKTISWLGCETSTTARDVPNLGESLRLIEERVSLRRHAVEDFFAQLPNWTTIMNSIAARWENYPYFPKESRWNEDRFPKASREVQQLGMGRSGPALAKVLSLPYWTRVWIVQEVALGNNVKLTFGSVSIDFEVFFLAYKCYVYHEAKSLGIQNGLTRATKVAIQARAAVADRDISMLRILQWGRHCESTNIVDRIYGLLGFLKFHEVGASSTFQSLEVDYNRDVALVFWDVVFAFRGSTAGIEAIEHEAYFMDQLVEFTELLPDLAHSLHCSFSQQSLLCYFSNEDDPPPEKQMTRLATRMVSIVRAVGRGIVRVRSDSLRLEPSRLSARFLQSLRSRRGLSSGSVEADLVTIFLEYADCDGVDERERLNVALIALEIAHLEDFECGKWSCMPAPDPPRKG